MQIFHRKEKDIRAGFPLAVKQEWSILPCFYPIQGTRGLASPPLPSKQSLLDYLKAIWETCYWQIAGECPGPPEARRAHHCLHGAIKGPPQLVSRSQDSETKPYVRVDLWHHLVALFLEEILSQIEMGKRTQHGRSKNAGTSGRRCGRREIGTQSVAAGFIKPGCFLPWLTTELPESQLRSCRVLALSPSRSLSLARSPISLQTLYAVV